VKLTEFFEAENTVLSYNQTNGRQVMGRWQGWYSASISISIFLRKYSRDKELFLQ